MKEIYRKKIFSFTVSALMSSLVCQSVSVNASDIEIYKTGFTPKPVVMFALDNSGSMSVNNTRSAYDLKDSMQAVLLGEGTISPVRNIRAGLSTFESPAWYPIKNGTDTLYYTAVHPSTPSAPRSNAGYIASPAQLLDSKIVYPSTRRDLFPANGDVITLNGNLNSSTQPSVTSGSTKIDANKKAYIRFQVDIPRGARINAAYLELRSNLNNQSKKLKIRVAQHADLYAANPTITKLQSFTGAATARTLQTGVDNSYLTKIFAGATTQRAVDAYQNNYTGDNIASPMYVYAMNVQSEMQSLIQNNSSWCGMGDVVFEVARDNADYTFYDMREDRVNPHLYVDWTLDSNTSRTNNCMFADTKRSSSQLVTNLGNVGVAGDMTARQSMNLQIQRIITDTSTPSTELYAETVAYMLGNSTKPLTNTNPSNTSIDVALSGLTTVSGSTLSYMSPIDSIRNYVANPNNTTYANEYTKEQQCGQHGVYFLTDGAPNTPTANDRLFASAMGWSSISCSSFDSCAQTMARGLLKASGYTQSNRQIKIKTSTVGFNYTGQALSSWASAGGGRYTSVSASDTGGAKAGIVSSINAFLDDIFSTTIPETVTGSPTLPQDALNPLRVLPYGYYASFVPKPQDLTQLWLGNLNKYNLLNGQLYGADKTTKLFNTDGSLNSSVSGIWTDGVKGQLPLGIVTGSKVNRTIYTNRKITNSVASEDKTLNQITFTSDYLNSDPQRNYWLNLLGYNVSANDQSDLSTYIGKTPDLRQLGATMHSTPILLTQSGTITSTLDTTTRQDYLLFGSTQGLLHVVDKDGKEVFAFVPNEMMNNTNQRNAFLSTTSSTAGSSNLFYGIDAPWAAYTQYVANSDGSLTVGTSDRSTTNNSIQGKQWVYGGLRMGGRSYYSLNLTNISSPSLKFHISPDDSSITNSTETTSNVSALSFMGQSWSKPTIARVKFAGQSKLVMIVGGGYDAGYESPNYDQTNQKGAGIYMFDADNGQLLWWASANASSATDVQGAQAVTANSNLKYSVVSQINAIDRDGDGYVDNLYFGDLGGQAFRIDLNNTTSTATQKIDARVVRLTNQHVTGGASPRFYEMPSVSAQTDSSLGLFVAVALSSGNRSSPLSGAISATGTAQNNTTASTSADDGVFVIYDKDIGNTNLYNSSYTLQTQDAALLSLNTNYAEGIATSNGGWFYRYGNGAGDGVWKGMNALYAIDSILYVNVYYRDSISGNSTCNGGIAGQSYLYRFCLPTGKCDRFTSSVNTDGTPDRVKLGAGILGAGLGASNATGNEVKSTITTSTDCTQAANKNKIECQSFSNAGTIRTLRWYEANQ
ncbi:pilus assembly protein [Acinetobacter brisouii]